MKTFQIMAFSAISLLAVSCGNTNKQTEEVDERFVDKVDEKTGILSLNPFTITDSVKVDGKTYGYHIDFHSVDSLPHITYQVSGAEYYDNAVKLAITRNGDTTLTKTFTKLSFKSHVPEKLYPTSGLIGFAYNIDRKYANTDDAFYFIATIGNLDDPEEIGYSLELKMDTHGGMSISKYEELGTASQSSGLTVDPDADGV